MRNHQLLFTLDTFLPVVSPVFLDCFLSTTSKPSLVLRYPFWSTGSQNCMPGSGKVSTNTHPGLTFSTIILWPQSGRCEEHGDAEWTRRGITWKIPHKYRPTISRVSLLQLLSSYISLFSQQSNLKLIINPGAESSAMLKLHNATEAVCPFTRISVHTLLGLC